MMMMMMMMMLGLRLQSTICGSNSADFGAGNIRIGLGHLFRNQEDRSLVHISGKALVISPSTTSTAVLLTSFVASYSFASFNRLGTQVTCHVKLRLATGCPPKMTQYFHDQLLAFLKAHKLTPETMPMPRS